jgi:hypothetical protein
MAIVTQLADGRFRRVIDTGGDLTPEDAIWLKIAIEQQIKNRTSDVAARMQIACPEGMEQGDEQCLKIVRKLGTVLERAEIVIWDWEIWHSAWKSGLDSVDALCGEPFTKEAMAAVSPAPEFWMHSRIGTHGGQLFDMPDHTAVAGILVSPGSLPCNGGDCSLPSFEIRDGIHEHYGVQFVFFFLPTSNQPEAGMEVVTVGAIYPAVVGSEPPDFFAPLLSCGRFLRTKFVDLRPAKSGLSRPQRRLAERKGRLMDISRVKTVCLRRRAESPHLAGNGGKEIEWQHQWVVSPHWRKQWYPSKGAHEPVYVESYLKGPEGKPLLPPRSTVYVVKR